MGWFGIEGCLVLARLLVVVPTLDLMRGGAALNSITHPIFALVFYNEVRVVDSSVGIFILAIENTDGA